MGSGAAMQTLRTQLFQLLFTKPFADKSQRRQPVKGFSPKFNKVTKHGQGLKAEWFTVLLLILVFSAHAG